MEALIKYKFRVIPETNTDYTEICLKGLVITIGAINDIKFMSLTANSESTLYITTESSSIADAIRILRLCNEYTITQNETAISEFKKTFAKAWRGMQANEWEMWADTILPLSE